MSDLTATIDAHLAGYAEPDASRRRELLAAAWSDNGVLIDPPLDGTGLDAIIGCAEAVVTHYPGHRFVRTTGVDSHHAIARYGWALCNPAGEAVLEGIDVAETDDTGRLARIIGFFGPLPGHE